MESKLPFLSLDVSQIVVASYISGKLKYDRNKSLITLKSAPSIEGQTIFFEKVNLLKDLYEEVDVNEKSTWSDQAGRNVTEITAQMKLKPDVNFDLNKISLNSTGAKYYLLDIEQVVPPIYLTESQYNYLSEWAKSFHPTVFNKYYVFSMEDSVKFLSLFRIKYETPKISVFKRFTFDSGHFLEDYSGKCFNCHGHTYILEVGVTGYLNPFTGMVIDFTLLKLFVNSFIEQYDHKVLNYQDARLKVKATAENLAWHLFQDLKPVLPHLSSIRVYEQPNSWVEIHDSKS